MSNKVERDDIDHLHINGIHVPTRTITLFGEVNEIRAAETINNLHVLASKNGAPINIKLMSFGGNAYDMFSIYDAIRDCNLCDIIITAYGYCMSAATVVMQAGDTRILAPHSRFMIHYGQDAAHWMHSKDFERHAEESKTINKMMEDIYLERIREKFPRYTRKKLYDLMHFDKYFSAEETIKLGLADKILGE